MRELKHLAKNSLYLPGARISVLSLLKLIAYKLLNEKVMKTAVLSSLLVMLVYEANGAACYTAWSAANEPYVGGDQVSRNGVNYTAKWWTTENPPAGSWTTNGACGEAPTLTTTGASGEGCTTLDITGDISNEGDPAVTEKGFLYSTNAATVDAATVGTPGGATKISIASGGTGAFTSNLTGLSSSTTYYFKAYALNTFGTSYGSRLDGTTTAACTAPTVTSTSSSLVECTSSTMEGNVTVHGNSPVTKGFIYHTSSAVVTAATVGSLGGAIKVDHSDVLTATGAYQYTEVGLSNSTTYYFKSYASNINGDSYGAVLNFTTIAGCTTPTVAATTSAVTVVCTTANPGGNVTADGGATITERGLCYDTNPNPTTAHSKLTEAGTTGSWTGSLTGLSEGTTYYVRAYATNAEGTTYGTQTSFTTLTCPAVTYWTIADGDYNTAANWNCNCIPDFTLNSHNSFRIYHDMTYTGTLSDWTSPGASYIMPGGSLTITGGLTVNLSSGGGDITAYEGATIDISGTFNMTGAAGLDFISGADITANNLTLAGASDLQTNAGTYTFGDIDLTSQGQVNLVNSTLGVTNDVDVGASAGITASGTPVSIGGDFNNGGNVDAVFDESVTVGGSIANTGSSDITFNGTATVGGNVTGTGNGNFHVNGSLDITGVLILDTDADLDGTGIVAFGSSAVNGQGNSHIICVGNKLRDNWAGNDPGAPVPANPIDLTSCGAGVLSAELLQFTANKNGNDVALKWITGSETNNDYFSVLSSEDGLNWEEIDLVQGAGNSSSMRTYESTDYDVIGQQRKYYRLRVVDYSKSSSLSAIRVVKFDSDGQIISAFENGSYLNVMHDVEGVSIIVSLFDYKGELVHIESAEGNDGEVASIFIPSRNLVSGLYFISLNVDNRLYSKKVIINK